jgi:hypothetical protein
MGLFSNLNILSQSKTIKALTALVEKPAAQKAAFIIPLSLVFKEINYLINSSC